MGYNPSSRKTPWFMVNSILGHFACSQLTPFHRSIRSLVISHLYRFVKPSQLDTRYFWVTRLTETDRNGPTKIPKRTSMGTETDRNGFQWVPKRTGTDFSSYRNELQWEPEKVGCGTIGTILTKLCMYLSVGR